MSSPRILPSPDWHRKDAQLTALVTIILFMLVRFFYALDGSGAALTTCQDRKRHFATRRAIWVTTEETFNSEKRPLWALEHSSIQLFRLVFTSDLLER
jgi:hypothetical protein